MQPGMSKAFTREGNGEDDEGAELPALPPQVKNYVTPAGLAAMQEELNRLLQEERPRVVDIVSWAAGNGDRSENGDYIYGKKRLREIDRRVRYLRKQLESAEVVDPARQQGLERVFFGATVVYVRSDGSEHKVKLVGVDEADATNARISWLSPVAQALMKAREGDTVELRTPGGVEQLEIVSILYE